MTNWPPSLPKPPWETWQDDADRETQFRLERELPFEPVSSRKLPAWDDDDAMLAWVDCALEERAIAEAVDHSAEWEVRWGEIHSEENLEAFEEWIRWHDPDWLIERLRSGSVPDALAAHVADLIAAGFFARRERTRAREKERKGRAAEDARWFEQVLREHYPKQNGIRERACELAGKRHGVRPESVQDYMTKRRGDLRL